MPGPTAGAAMRVLVVSDVHGNLAALEAVLAEPYDLVLCLGDLVGFGPDPGVCVRRLREIALVVVQGDYDRAVAESLPWPERDALDRLAHATTGFTGRQLATSEREYLSAFPRWAITDAPGVRCLLVHGTPADALYGTLSPEPRDWWPDLAGATADVVLVGQTHRQFNVAMGPTRVVSPGSAGLPLDGDPRAAYAVLDDGEILLQRKPYPVEETIDALRLRGLSGPALRGLERLFRSGSPPTGEIPLPVAVADPQEARGRGDVSW